MILQGNVMWLLEIAKLFLFKFYKYLQTLLTEKKCMKAIFSIMETKFLN